MVGQQQQVTGLKQLLEHLVTRFTGFLLQPLTPGCHGDPATGQCHAQLPALVFAVLLPGVGVWIQSMMDMNGEQRERIRRVVKPTPGGMQKEAGVETATEADPPAFRRRQCSKTLAERRRASRASGPGSAARVIGGEAW